MERAALSPDSPASSRAHCEPPSEREEERRRAPRVGTVIAADFTRASAAGRRHRGEVLNLSQRGLFLATELELEQGEELCVVPDEVGHARSQNLARVVRWGQVCGLAGYGCTLSEPGRFPTSSKLL